MHCRRMSPGMHQWQLNSCTQRVEGSTTPHGSLIMSTGRWLRPFSPHQSSLTLLPQPYSLFLPSVCRPCLHAVDPSGSAQLVILCHCSLQGEQWAATAGQKGRPGRVGAAVEQWGLAPGCARARCHGARSQRHLQPARPHLLAAGLAHAVDARVHTFAAPRGRGPRERAERP